MSERRGNEREERVREQDRETVKREQRKSERKRDKKHRQTNEINGGGGVGGTVRERQTLGRERGKVRNGKRNCIAHRVKQCTEE